MRTIGRFAPSPTGPLHFGSLVAAVASWLDARAAGGEWHLRIEDVDAPRTVPGAEAVILRQLEAFGLHWDGPVIRQSERTHAYEAALERLTETGFTYRCRCSRREIADSGLLGIDGMVYPGTCRNAHAPANEPAAIRFRVPPGVLVVRDRLQGELAQDLARDIGDFVIRRRDGLFAYQLAVVVDDAALGVTDIVRGADLLDSTPRQVALQRALSLPTPRYLHVPVVTRHGEKLSKQALAASVDEAHRLTALQAALSLLGQSSDGTADVGDPSALLALAVPRWDPRRIPEARSLEMQRGG